MLFDKILFDLSGDVNQTIFADGSGTKRNEVDTSINGLKVYHQNRWSSGLGQIIKCKPNTKYTVSATIIDEQQIGGFINSWIDGLWYGARMYFKPDGNKKKRQSFTFTTGPYQDEIKITFNNNNETDSNTSPMVIYKDIMVEESESATNYEKRVTEEKIIPLAQPLRGLPNGIKDTIIKKDGIWYIKRMTKEVVLDGSSNFNYWIENNINENTSSFVVHTGNDDSYKNHDEVNVVTDKMPFYEGYYKGRKSVSISGYGDNTAIFVGSLPNSVLKSIDGNGIAQYFRENPVRVVYRLANPIYEPLSTNLDALMYSGNMHIFNNSKISANLKINIDRITNISISKTELAEAITDSTSLSEARSWVNEMKDSLTKDLLQKRLNDIGINDMGSVEKKTVTANADIYITPQNILSLSLDTNSIIFEEYDGVEDSEKKML